ncbi:hypothetical protein ABZY42_19760 [Streptomyces sp. NPDC006622]
MSRTSPRRLTRTEHVRLVTAALAGALSGAARAAMTWFLDHARP